MVPDPFDYTAEKIAAITAGKRLADAYDVYNDFPRVKHLQSYTPTCILVTGAAGFIASHVVIRLCKLYAGYRIIAVDKLGYASNERYVTEPLAGCSNFRFVRADVCDYEFMLQLMLEEQVDTVLHLAAQSHVDLSFREGGARQFVQDNVAGTASLLEAARKRGVGRFILCSTDEVYGEGSLEDRVEFHEGSLIAPSNPYAATKAGADLLAQTFYRSFGMPIIVTRGNNVYGPHQFYEKVIPKFIAQLKSGGRVTIHGSGGNTRNFMHVQDTASAFDCILHSGSVGQVYNISGRNEKAVVEVAADILLTLGLEGRRRELVEHVADRAHNDACYPIAGAKLAELGWHEEHSWEFGLANTVAWFSDRLSSQAYDIGRFISAHPSHSATDSPLRRRSSDAALLRGEGGGSGPAETLDRAEYLARMDALWERAQEAGRLAELAASAARLEGRLRRGAGAPCPRPAGGRPRFAVLMAVLAAAALAAVGARWPHGGPRQ